MATRYSRLTGAFLVTMLALAACGNGGLSNADVSGTWLGTISEGAVPVRVVFNLSLNPDGKFAGTTDLPDQGGFGISLSQIEVRGRHVVLAAASLDVSFSGDLSADGNTLAGTATQAGQTTTLVLEKQPGPLDYRRPQDPVKPYPYNCVDVTFANSDAGITLAGTLTWPQGAGPFRTVVLIAGSGPQNRNEELMNHRPFLVLSDALTRAGIATLRYDKRGVGQSGGDYAGATSPDFAADARAAVQYLRGQASFVASSIGLVGHSEGGLLAPTAAYANPDVAFLVLLAGPGVPGDEVLISQARAIGAVQGMSTDQLDEAEALNRRLYACFRATSDPKELERQLRDVLTSAGVTGAQQDAVIAELNTPWMRFFVTYDPAPVLTRTAIPVLALNGSLDLQVLPDLNLPPIQAALQGAGNQQATVQKLAGLNHLFQHAITGAPTEYGSIDETMAPEVLAQVAGWITSL
jgi:pimeloyl-ACP methyl ester carboxylesterase